MIKKLSYLLVLLFIGSLLYAGSSINMAKTSGLNYGDIPVGTILAYSSTSTIPTDWLYCNGASISTITYNQLFNVIRYSYGGAGANFNLPDLRGMFLRGVDAGRGIDTDTTRVLGSTQTENYLAHTHGFHDDSGYDYNSGLNNWARYSAATPYGTWPTPGGVDRENVRTITILNSGGSETRPDNVAVSYIIKYRQATTVAINVASEVNSANSVNLVADKNNIGNGSTVNVMIGNTGNVIVSSTGTSINNAMSVNNTLYANQSLVAANLNTSDKSIMRVIYSTFTGANSTSVSLTGLDGDIDLIYDLKLNIIPTTSCDLYIRINGDSNNEYLYYKGVVTNAGITGVSSGGEQNKFILGSITTTSGEGLFGEMTIYGKSGVWHKMVGQSFNIYGGGSTGDTNYFTCIYEETTKITSITIEVTQANGIAAGSFIELSARR